MMALSHSGALAVGYGVALAAWLVLWRGAPKLALWPAPAPETFARPWREVLYALLGVVAVLGVGQLYQRGWLLPRAGALATVWESINQLLIFSPLFLLLILRRHSLRTAWLPIVGVWKRVLAGVCLAWLAIVALSLVRAGSDGPAGVLGRLAAHPRKLDIAVQVLLEDAAIAIVLVRLGQALRSVPLAAAGAALLFAAGHIPAMVSNGATAGELLQLAIDFALALGALLIVQHSRDMWWFWCVHFSMDMMQFVAVPAS